MTSTASKSVSTLLTLVTLCFYIVIKWKITSSEQRKSFALVINKLKASIRERNAVGFFETLGEVLIRCANNFIRSLVDATESFKEFIKVLGEVVWAIIQFAFICWASYTALVELIRFIKRIWYTV